VATCFNSRNVAGQCEKENCSKGGKLYKLRLAIAEDTWHKFIWLSGQKGRIDEKLGQLIRPPFASSFANLSECHSGPNSSDPAFSERGMRITKPISVLS
jgi:hypothetical protein